MKAPPEARPRLLSALNSMQSGRYQEAARTVSALKSRATPEFSGYILAIEICIQRANFGSARGLMDQAAEGRV